MSPAADNIATTLALFTPLSLNKDAPTSLHQQLVTQLSMLIASGQLAPGGKLPSVRQLAQRLGVHYNTVLTAYQSLCDDKLIESRQGSGYRVVALHSHTGLPMTPLDDWLSPVEKTPDEHLTQMVQMFIQLARRYGFEREAIAHTFGREWDAVESLQATPVVFVDGNADILPVFESELSSLLGMPVQTATTDDLATWVDAPTTPLLLATRYHHATITERYPNLPTPLLLETNPNQADLQRIKELNEGDLVAVVSQSQIVLDMAGAMISGLRGFDVLYQPVLLTKEALQTHTLPHTDMTGCLHAKCIFVDVSCLTAVLAWVDAQTDHRYGWKAIRRRVSGFPLLNPDDQELLKKQIALRLAVPVN